MKVVWLLAIAFALQPVSTHAADCMDTDTFLRRYNVVDGPTQQMYLAYLSGLQSGFAWSQTHYKTRLNQPGMYCPPRNTEFSVERLLDILRKEAAERPHYAKAPVPLALMEALRSLYPCESGS